MQKKGGGNMHYSYKTHGTCSSRIDFDIENGIVSNVVYEGGCSGNTQGVSRLVEGLSAEEVIRRLKGIRCGWKETSCPDQLACAIEKALQQ